MSYKTTRERRSKVPGFPLYVTETQKNANSGALAKDYMDFFDYSFATDEGRVRNMNENWELHSGRWSAIEKIDPHMSIFLGTEEVTLGAGQLRHYPINNKVSQSQVGDMILAPFVPVIKDYSSRARNHRERVRLERVKESLRKKFIEPRMLQISQQYDASNGIADITQLSPEEQLQRQQDINQRLKNETPEEIKRAIDRFNTPDEIVAQLLFDYESKRVKLKNKFDMGSESAVVNAEAYFKVVIQNDRPAVESLNEKFVTWAGSELTEYSQDGVFAKYEQYLSPQEAISKHALALSKMDIKKIDNLFSDIPGYNRDNDSTEKGSSGIESRMLDFFANNPQIEADVDVRTREGQSRLQEIYKLLAGGHRAGTGVRETYVTWMWSKKVSYVEQFDRTTNRIRSFITNEHYVKNTNNGDLKVEHKVIPQAWHGTKLHDELYLNVEPIPGQYNDPNHPFEPKLSIYGGKLNVYRNNAKNSSFMDLSKPFQYRYNVVMKKMEDHQNTDIGKVFLGTANMKPKNWSWGQWYKSLFVARTAIVANHKPGANSFDQTIYRSIDMGRSNEIQNDIGQLTYLEDKIYEQMSYNKQKLGQISEYATDQNTQLSALGVERQQMRFRDKYRQIKEEVSNALLRLALIAYIDNEDVKSAIFDDFSRAHYEENFKDLDGTNFYLHVVDDFKESEKLEQMRNLALTFLQNGMTGRTLSAIISASSLHEINQILEDNDIRQQEELAEEREHQKVLTAQQTDAAQKQLQLAQEYNTQVNERNNEVKLITAELNSTLLAKGNDINENQVSDSLEKAREEIKSKEKMHDKDLRAKIMMHSKDNIAELRAISAKNKATKKK